jgi:hypothetical protein
VKEHDLRSELEEQEAKYLADKEKEKGKKGQHADAGGS